MSRKILISTGLYWSWLIMLVLVLDLTSKYLTMKYAVLDHVEPVCKFINVYYIRNYGLVFGLYPIFNKERQRLFLIFIDFGICIFLLIRMFYTHSSKKLINFFYALMIGGALGNILDRLFHGFVVDMIDIYIDQLHFVTFNVADICILLSVMFFLLKNFNF